MNRAFALAIAVTFVSSSVAMAAWPVASRTSYVSRGYSSGHKALDIAANRGTRVVPMRSGKTVFAGYKRNCGGYQVWISHGSGLYSAYYHLSRETSWRGEYVTGGSETIGYVGTSGCASGPHLHIEVWRGYPWRSGSRRVNPWNYVDSGTYLPSRYR
jgi:murein DD-endopeptidase MepM/ murein hydrolase activator NlpD